MWAVALDLYMSLEGGGASGRVADGRTAARAVSEEFPDEATTVSCCGITDMNNTTILFVVSDYYKWASNTYLAECSEALPLYYLNIITM